MKVSSASFVKSAAHPSQFPTDGRPEIAFVGRSNVGKSTVLNRLLNRRNLAKTSKTPGKTRTINFFDVNGRFYFVDLPGYGFARVAKSVKEKWAQVMTDYLRSRKPLRLAVQLIDARHEPTALDHDMLGLLDEAGVPTLLVATKIDKVGRSHYTGCIETIRRCFELDEDALILPCSGATGEGADQIWDVIAANL